MGTISLVPRLSPRMGAWEKVEGTLAGQQSHFMNNIYRFRFAESLVGGIHTHIIQRVDS